MAAVDLESRVSKLANAVGAFSAELRLALRYIHSDANSSLTKSRLVMEKLLLAIYVAEMGQEPRKPLLGEMLTDNQFTRKIERRILPRMNAIRELGNLGTHGEFVEASDAAKALDDLCEVLDWYLGRYGTEASPAPQLGKTRAAVVDTRILCICSPQYLSALLGSLDEFQALKREMARICLVFAGADNGAGRFVEAPGVDAEGFTEAMFDREYDIIQAGLYVHAHSGRVYFSGFDPVSGTVTSGAEDSISVEAFAALIQQSKAQLIIMIACDSLTVAARLFKFTNVIAGSRQVSVSAVIAWEKLFYRCLGRGDPLSQAVETANSLSGESMTLLLNRDIIFAPLAPEDTEPGAAPDPAV